MQATQTTRQKMTTRNSPPWTLYHAVSTAALHYIVPQLPSQFHCQLMAALAHPSQVQGSATVPKLFNRLPVLQLSNGIALSKYAHLIDRRQAVHIWLGQYSESDVDHLQICTIQ